MVVNVIDPPIFIKKKWSDGYEDEVTYYPMHWPNGEVVPVALPKIFYNALIAEMVLHNETFDETVHRVIRIGLKSFLEKQEKEKRKRE